MLDEEQKDGDSREIARVRSILHDYPELISSRSFREELLSEIDRRHAIPIETHVPPITAVSQAANGFFPLESLEFRAKNSEAEKTLFKNIKFEMEKQPFSDLQDYLVIHALQNIHTSKNIKTVLTLVRAGGFPMERTPLTLRLNHLKKTKKVLAWDGRCKDIRTTGKAPTHKEVCRNNLSTEEQKTLDLAVQNMAPHFKRFL